MANIKFKILDKDKLILELLEDAKKGDLIELKKIFEKNQEYISNFGSEIKSEYEDKIKKNVEDKILEQTKEIQKNTVNNFKNNDEYVKLIEQKNKLEEGKKSFEIIKKLEIKDKTRELENKNKTLENKIKTLKENLETSKEFISRENNAVIKEFEKTISEQSNDLERWKNKEKKLNIKQKGEKLEEHILREFEKLCWEDNIKFFKTTTTKKGKKPDFLFEIKDHDEQSLVKIILEAKTEFCESTNKTKNSQHYKTLEINRKNFEADYAILISELEMDDFFVVKKINQPEYEKLYVIRPDFFISFLSIVRIFALKDIELKSKQINFQDKLKILEGFKQFKEVILHKHIDNIEKNISKMKRSAEVILKESLKISKSTDVILDTHLKNTISAIEKYDIEKKIITQIK